MPPGTLQKRRRGETHCPPIAGAVMPVRWAPRAVGFCPLPQELLGPTSLPFSCERGSGVSVVSVAKGGAGELASPARAPGTDKRGLVAYGGCKAFVQGAGLLLARWHDRQPAWSLGWEGGASKQRQKGISRPRVGVCWVSCGGCRLALRCLGRSCQAGGVAYAAQGAEGGIAAWAH